MNTLYLLISKALIPTSKSNYDWPRNRTRPISYSRNSKNRWAATVEFGDGFGLKTNF